MTALSTRFAWVATARFVVGAVPVWFHAISESRYEDCSDPEAFFNAERIGGARMQLPKRAGGTAGDTKGQRYAGATHPLRVRAFRLYDVSRLYGSPMSFGYDSMGYLVGGETRQIESGDDVLPVHWSSYEMQGKVHIEAYAYAQGGIPVRHPIESGLALAWSQLLQGTRPVTVFILSAQGTPDEVPALSDAAEQWFAAAWKSLKASCGT
ncbi:MAG: hypothetical protein GY944_20515 [bacterium]|nr:hypothetical protein [bacterium]